jgi:phage repressor protein C with HTH and peptisase S24 domain
MDYNAVIKRLSELLDAKNDTDLARRLGLSSGTAISNWRSRSTLDLKKIMNACPNVDLNWLFYGEERERKAIGIPLIPIDAIAGRGAPAYQDLPIENYYTVNEFRNADFLIRVKGDSMMPKYKAGDIVACKKVDDIFFWQWHTIYVIATRSQGVLIKRIDPGTELDNVTCVSENPAYRPFQVPRSDIISAALVMGAITLE